MLIRKYWSRRRFELLLPCLLFIRAMELPAIAALPASRNIDSGWEFRVAGDTDKPELTQWHPAQVPGVIQTDLLRN